jgi:tetratricopeptide (TPR) repeat protein
LNKSQQALVNYEKIVNSYIPRLFLSINHIATIYAGLGELCMVLKKYELALINMEIAVGVEQLRRPQPDGRSLAHYYLFIGKIHTGLGNRNEAITYYQLAIDLAKQFYPRHHPLLAYCMTSKMSLLYQENRLEEIVPHFQESGNILANSLSNNHGMQVFVHMTTAQNLLDKGDCEGALRSYQAALQCSHQHIPSNHPKNAHILCPMAHVYNRQRRFDEALSILQNTLNIQTAALPANHSDLAITYTLLGEVFENQRNPLALSYYQRALDIQLRHRPPTDSITIHLQQAISRLQRRH